MDILKFDQIGSNGEKLGILIFLEEDSKMNPYIQKSLNLDQDSRRNH